MKTEDKLRGTYRVADGSRVQFADALAAWVPVTYDELLATARKYHWYVNYGELGECVQELSGIRTRMLLDLGVAIYALVMDIKCYRRRSLDERSSTNHTQTRPIQRLIVRI